MRYSYRGHTIRQSGKDWLRVYDSNGNGITPRVKNIEAGKALVDCHVEHRVMTPDEHKLIHGTVEPVSIQAFQVWFNDGSAVSVDAFNTNQAREKALTIAHNNGYRNIKVTRVY